MSKTVIFGTSGIGGAVAKLLVKAGRPVHLIARNEARLQSQVEELGDDLASYSVCDVTKGEAGIEKAVNDAGESLAGLCYSIGSINLKPLSRLTLESMTADFALNAGCAALAVKAASKKLEAGSGVVLFSTVAVRQGFASHAGVAMAKGAVEGLTAALSVELAPRHIRVNAIAPSLTATDLAKPLLGAKDAIGKTHPLGRVGEPEDIAPLVALLLGSESAWTTGAIIAVDGGRGRGRAT